MQRKNYNSHLMLVIFLTGCRGCGITYMAYADAILKQLDLGHRRLFPVVLTKKAACDVKVITLLRTRTLGNSPTALLTSIQEVHAEEHLTRSLLYLTHCKVWYYNDTL